VSLVAIAAFLIMPPRCGRFPAIARRRKLHSQSGNGAGFYSRKQVLALTTLSNTTLWREIGRGHFPKPVRISPGRIGFARPAVEAWIEAVLSQLTSEPPIAA